jgi:hypothetical protein
MAEGEYIFSRSAETMDAIFGEVEDARDTYDSLDQRLDYMREDIDEGRLIPAIESSYNDIWLYVNTLSSGMHYAFLPAASTMAHSGLPAGDYMITIMKYSANYIQIEAKPLLITSASLSGSAVIYLNNNVNGAESGWYGLSTTITPEE